ncbi:MAG: hypothetical protein SFX74_06060 [Fimbriimonadaceae bacterium]|nr:hypothetical protein [Fimbriimonadaceae bacterium]
MAYKVVSQIRIAPILTQRLQRWFDRFVQYETELDDQRASSELSARSSWFAKWMRERKRVSAG